MLTQKRSLKSVGAVSFWGALSTPLLQNVVGHNGPEKGVHINIVYSI